MGNDSDGSAKALFVAGMPSGASSSFLLSSQSASSGIGSSSEISDKYPMYISPDSTVLADSLGVPVRFILCVELSGASGGCETATAFLWVGLK